MLKDLVKNTRSYRRFDAAWKIEREMLADLVDTARFTASSVNKQPFKFLISCDDRTNRCFFQHLKWGRLLKDWPGPDEKEQPSGYIAILFDRALNFPPKPIDVGIIAQTIALGATEKGLASCMIANFVEPELRTELGLPEQYHIELVIAIGKGAETIVLEEVRDGATAYYRDAADRHHVPKRSLAEVLLDHCRK